MTSMRLGVVILIASLSSWSCGEETIQKINPAIQVEDLEGVKAELVEFEVLPVGDELEQLLVVSSLTVATLEVTSLELEGIGAAHFALEEESFSVPGRSKREFTIYFRPQAVGDHEATLVISSSAPDRPKVEVVLQGKGIDSAIQVEGCLASTVTQKDRCSLTMVTAPDPLDLGKIVAGTPETARIIVTNLGRKPLELESVAFEDPDAASKWGFSLPGGIGKQTINGLTSGGLTLGFHPPQDLVEEVEVVLVLTSSDSANPEIRFPIRANVVPNEAPLACIRFLEVRRFDGKALPIPPGEQAVISPGDRLVFDARVEEGCSGDPEDGESVELEWTVESSEDFPYELSNEGDPFVSTFLADVIGRFSVSLKVTDRHGQSATQDADGNPATLEFRVEPREDIGVEIRWQGFKGADLDIHLVKRDGVSGFFGPNDFYWNNKGVSWGGSPPISNPRLAVDDKGSKMVESILLNLPDDGEVYSIFVHFQRDERAERMRAPACTEDFPCPQGSGLSCSLTTDTAGVCMPGVVATVRLFLLREEWDFSFQNPGFRTSAALGSPCETWWVGDVRWDDVSPTFVAAPSNILWLGDGVSGATCHTKDD